MEHINHIFWLFIWAAIAKLNTIMKWVYKNYTEMYIKANVKNPRLFIRVKQKLHNMHIMIQSKFVKV